MPSIRLDQSVIAGLLVLLVLDVCNDPLLLVHHLVGCATTGGLGRCLASFGSFGSRDFGEPLVVLSEFLRMDLFLELLGLRFLLKGTILRDLLNVKFMLPLELVSGAASA